MLVLELFVEVRLALFANFFIGVGVGVGVFVGSEWISVKHIYTHVWIDMYRYVHNINRFIYFVLHGRISNYFEILLSNKFQALYWQE